MTGQWHPRVDRIEVIDETGRAFALRLPAGKTSGATVVLQDEERTMKVFLGQGNILMLEESVLEEQPRTPMPAECTG